MEFYLATSLLFIQIFAIERMKSDSAAKTLLNCIAHCDWPITLTADHCVSHATAKEMWQLPISY